MGLAAVLEVRRHPAAALVSVLAGGPQVVRIAGEQLVVQRYDALQPVMALVGLLVIGLSGWCRSAHHRPHPDVAPAAAAVEGGPSTSA